MASRYWVGGTGNWSSTSHWSTTSGGSSGASVPTLSDDVFIDSNSGFGSGGTITLDVDAYCNDFTANSGHNYTIDGVWNLWIYNDAVLESGITCSFGQFIISGSGTGRTITSNGCVLSAFATSDNDYSGSISLADDMEVSGEFYQGNGTFDANDHNVTANDFYFYADTGFTPTVYMGSGTWEATNRVGFYVDEYNGETVTINAETSTIKLDATTDNGFNGDTGLGSATDSAIFENDVDGVRGGNHTFYNLEYAGSNAIAYLFSSATFNNIKVNSGIVGLFPYEGLTNTVTSFTVSGTIGNLIKITSVVYSSGGGGGFIQSSIQHTFSKSSGVVSCDYLDISNSNAIGGATWYAGSHSVDTTNNDGWIFTDAPGGNVMCVISS